MPGAQLVVQIVCKALFQVFVGHIKIFQESSEGNPANRASECTTGSGCSCIDCCGRTHWYKSGLTGPAPPPQPSSTREPPEPWPCQGRRTRHREGLSRWVRPSCNRIATRDRDTAQWLSRSVAGVRGCKRRSWQLACISLDCLNLSNCFRSLSDFARETRKLYSSLSKCSKE